MERETERWRERQREGERKKKYKVNIDLTFQYHQCPHYYVTVRRYVPYLQSNKKLSTCKIVRFFGEIILGRLVTSTKFFEI